MHPQIDLRFRPSLIVFVDEAGEEVCHHLKSIIHMAQLDEILHPCIALVQVKTGEDQATPIPVGDQFPQYDENMPVEPADWDKLITDALISIRLDSRLGQVTDAGYPVPISQPQIYIVGDAHSDELKTIHETVQRLLTKRGLTTLVCYVLDAYDAAITDAHYMVDDPMGPKDTSYWLQREVPNFCYFYEGEFFHRKRHTVTHAQSQYAAAETLFALIATGITPEPRFEQFMQLPPNLTNYTHVGSIGTTMIIFPREEILEYSSARLGFDLLQQWQNDINRDLLSGNQRKGLQELAYSQVGQLEHWIKDGEKRPSASGDESEAQDDRSRKGDSNERQENTWPSLDILRSESTLVSPRINIERRAMHREVYDRTRALFRLFHFGDVGEAARRQRKRRDAWTRVADQRAMRAVGAYVEWEQAATQAWEAAGARACMDIKHEVDLLWSSRENGSFGFEMAKTYADAYFARFIKLEDYLVSLRDIHEREYRASLDTFEELSNGEWLRAQNIVNDPRRSAAAPPRAVPTVGVQPDENAEPGNTGDDGADGAAEGSDDPEHLNAHEQQIADQLEARILWLHDQFPSIPTQITISLPFVLAAILSGFALWIQGNLLFKLVLVVLVIAIICIMNWVFWKKYQRRVVEARKDLLRFYRQVYVSRCERSEDRLRLLVTRPMRNRLLAMRQRLDNISAFIGRIQFQLDSQAGRVRRNLFNNPSGVRDVYIANGERLQSRGTNTIEDFEALVRRQRETHPMRGCEWHRSLQEMRERLIEEFRALRLSIIEMDEEEARGHIFAFTSDSINAYLRGPLVDIRRGLDKRAVWIEALERAQSPLYRAEVGSREPQMLFVCGQRADLNEGQNFWPSNTTPVIISDCHDWVLIVALFSGGLPPAFNPDKLFPPKHVPITPPPGGMDGEDPDAWANPLAPMDAPDIMDREVNEPDTNPAFPTDIPGVEDRAVHQDQTNPIPPEWILDDADRQDDANSTPPTDIPGNVDRETDDARAKPAPPADILGDEDRPDHQGDANPALPVDIPDAVYNYDVPPVLGALELARKFQRYERHLVDEIAGEKPNRAIDDPDLELPIRFRLAQIQTDTNALKTFIKKNQAAYNENENRFASNSSDSLHAYYTARHGFAVRYGQRMFGTPAKELLPWPDLLQHLFEHVQDPELQQLVKEDMALTPLGASDLDRNEEYRTIIPPRVPPPPKKQPNDNAAQLKRSDSSKLRAVKLNRMEDQAEVIEPDTGNSY